MNRIRKITVLPSLLLTAGLGLGAMHAQASGIPTFDAANLTQSIVSALESVSQTTNLVQQYQTQLQQYQLQLINIASPSIHLWSQAQRTMNDLIQALDTLNYQKQQLGSLTAYLNQFQGLDHYLNSPCFNGGQCTSADRAAIVRNQQAVSKAQKLANDAAIRGLERQQNTLAADAATLQSLQAAAQGAEGQLAAISYANQLASHQSNQLLQIRALLVAQQNAIVTRNQALASKEAQLEAAKAQAREGTYVSSKGMEW